MGVFGDRLRREREMRGVSLDEIAQATKIGTRLLRALEEEQFDLLPGGIFNKGFVRAYAKYLGINEEQAVADYMQAAGESELEFREFTQNQADIYSRGASESTGNRGFPILPVLILLVIVAAGFGGWKLYQQHLKDRDSAASTSAEAGVPSTSQVSSPSSTANQTSPTAAPQSNTQPVTNPSNSATGPTQAEPTNSSGLSSGQQVSQPAQTQPAAAGLAAGKNFQVALHTTGPAWVSIKADGKIAVRGIVPADQTKTIQADDEIIVWTGNAGVTQLSFNGNPVPVTGQTNEVKLLVFKSNGLQPPKTPASTEPAQRSQEPSTKPQ